VAAHNARRVESGGKLLAAVLKRYSARLQFSLRSPNQKSSSEDPDPKCLPSRPHHKLQTNFLWAPRSKMQLLRPQGLNRKHAILNLASASVTLTRASDTWTPFCRVAHTSNSTINRCLLMWQKAPILTRVWITEALDRTCPQKVCQIRPKIGLGQLLLMNKGA